MASSSRSAPAPDRRVLALFGPTASGKTAVAGLLRDRLGADVVSADSAAVYAGLRPGGVCVTIEPGEGHAAASLDIAESLGVTEKDMPPHHVIATGRAIGFTDFRVYARSGAPALLCGFDAASPLWPVRPGRWRSAYRFARRALRALLFGPRDEDRQFLFRLPQPAALRDSNIVWMRK